MGATRNPDIVELRVRIVCKHPAVYAEDRIRRDPIAHYTTKEEEACDHGQANPGSWVQHVCAAQNVRYAAALICTPNVPHCYAVMAHVERVKFTESPRPVHHVDVLQVSTYRSS